MRAILSNRASAALQRLVDRASEQRIAVLCLECDHDRCHRAVITEMAVERNAGIDVLRML